MRALRIAVLGLAFTLLASSVWAIPQLTRYKTYGREKLTYADLNASLDNIKNYINTNFLAGGTTFTIGAGDSLVVDRELVEVLLLANGSAAAPSMAFQGDEDLGLYRVGANRMGIASLGTLVATVGPQYVSIAKPFTTVGSLTVSSTATFANAITVTGLADFNGEVSSDATTETSSGTTGAIHTDGGLGVAKDIYVGDDILQAAASVQNWGAGDVTWTHSAGKLTLGGDGAVELDFANHEMTNVDINSGAIDATTVGSGTPAAGAFTTLSATTGGSLAGTWTTLGTVSAATSITSTVFKGAIDGTVGAVTPAAGTFTTLNATGEIRTTHPTASSQISQVATGAGEHYWDSRGIGLAANFRVSNAAAVDRTALILAATGAATFYSTVSGAFNGTIGATTPAAGTFTALTSNGIDDNAAATSLTISETNKMSLGGADGDLLDAFTASFVITGGTSGDKTASLQFQGERTGNNAFGLIDFFHAGTNRVASIQGLRDGADDAAALTLWTTPTAGALTEALRISSAQQIFINESANTFAAGPSLTIQQGANDDEGVAVKSSDVAHGITTLTETDTYFSINKTVATTGAANLRGWGEADFGVILQGTSGTANTTKTAAGNAPVQLVAGVKSGTTAGVPGANANIVVAKDVGGSARFIVDVEGDLFADGGTTTAAVTVYDEHPDVAILTAMDRVRSAEGALGFIDPGGPSALESENYLIEKGFLGGPRIDAPDSSRGLWNITQIQHALRGAIRQEAQRTLVLENALMQMQMVVARIESDNRVLRTQVANLRNVGSFQMASLTLGNN